MTTAEQRTADAIMELGSMLTEEHEYIISQVDLASYLGISTGSMLLRVALAYLQGKGYLELQNGGPGRENVIIFNPDYYA